LVVLIALATGASLSSCVLLPIVGEAAQNGPVNDRPVNAGPEGWEVFASCEGGPRDDYVWIDGFPSTELESAGVNPDCGDTFIKSDGDSFMDVADYSLTVDQLNAIEAALVASGWEKKWDDFDPLAASGAAGARDFYRDNDQRLVAIEIYRNPSSSVSFTAYIDYHSPETRALR
jgi:hypothetical protein